MPEYGVLYTTNGDQQLIHTTRQLRQAYLRIPQLHNPQYVAIRPFYRIYNQQPTNERVDIAGMHIHICILCKYLSFNWASTR